MLNNVDLVTVTCTRDCGIQLLQSYSLDLMVAKPCVHYIIVEDDRVDIEEWRSLLATYYTRHKLNLIPSKTFLPSEYYLNDSKIKNGWHRQIVLKLLVANLIESNRYLILDSKNFFVHQQDLQAWPIAEGNGIIENYNSRGWTEVEDFCFKNNITLPDKVYSASTPFMAQTSIVKEILKADIFPLFLEKKGWWAGEFFLYSIFTQYLGNTLISADVPNVTFWNSERPLTESTLGDIYTWPNMRTFGLHRDVLKLGIDRTEIVSFLVKLGFDTDTVNTTLNMYQQDVMGIKE
jgi:Family of unknown function (DUF6492)